MYVTFRIAVAAAIVFFAAAVSPAADSKTKERISPTFPWTEQRDENPIQTSSNWNDIEGHRVAIEGMAWGSGDKGLGQHVVLHDGQCYVDGGDFQKLDLDGKLVRVVGNLTVRHVKKSPPWVQGYASDFDAVIIKATDVKKIDRVTWPWVEDLGKSEKK